MRVIVHSIRRRTGQPGMADLLLFLLVLCLSGFAAPTDDEISRAVRELGAADFKTREQATTLLRSAGKAAERALEQASQSDDPEVSVRARRLLIEVRMGITPDWPEAMVELALGYEKLDSNGQDLALDRLRETLGNKSVGFLLWRIGIGDARECEAALKLLREPGDEDTADRVIAALKGELKPAEHRALAWAFDRKGRDLEALQSLAKCGGLEDQLRHALVEKCVKALLDQLRARDDRPAADAAARLAEAVPNEPRFLYLHAEALARHDKHEEAKALRDKALSLHPTEEAPHFTAGEMLTDLGQDAVAVREWEMILKIPPRDEVYDINAHLRMAGAHERARRYADAADCFERALGLYHRAKAASSGMAMTKSEDEVRRHIASLRAKAREKEQNLQPPLSDVANPAPNE